MSGVDNEDILQVPAIISDDKLNSLKIQIIQTILGLHIEQQSSYLLQIIMYICIPSIMILIGIWVPIKEIAIFLPTVLIFIIVLIIHYFVLGFKQFYNYIFLILYTLLWNHHLYLCTQDILLCILSTISIGTSISTITINAVKQFSNTSPIYQQLSFNSSAYIRFIIVLPLLLIQVLIYYINPMIISITHFYQLKLISSSIFIFWILGIASSFQNMIYFICNSINHILLGDQSKPTIILVLYSLVLNLSIIAINYAILLSFKNQQVHLFIGATLTSIIYFCILLPFIKQRSSTYFQMRMVVKIIGQIVITIALCLAFKLANLENINLTIPLAINSFFYLLFKVIQQLQQSRSHFGFLLGLKLIQNSTLSFLERFILRITSAFCIICIAFQISLSQLSYLLQYQQITISYVILPILLYRSFKRCLAETLTFSLHFSLFLGLITYNLGYELSAMLIILFMPPFPPNAYLAFLSLFLIPQKAKHRLENYYMPIYLLFSIFGVLLQLLSLGTLELTMFFGLPIFFCSIPTHTQGYQSTSPQNSLYLKIIPNIDSSIFRGYKVGFYLLRISKYIILVQVKSQCYGFGELLNFRGLEVQEITSCHNRQSETIDNLVEKTWGSNKITFDLSTYCTVLFPLQQLSINVPTENQIQLTGIIQAEEFIQLFKSATLKALIRYFSKSKSLTLEQKEQGQLIISEFSSLMSKEKVNNIFPYDFAQQSGIKVHYPSNPKKLPPIKKVNKMEIVNEFKNLVTDGGVYDQSIDELKIKPAEQENSHLEMKQFQLEQINLSYILTMYHYMFGNRKYINTALLFAMIKEDNSELTQIEFEGHRKLASQALSSALKISIEKYIQGQSNITLQDLESYDQDSFLGISGTKQFTDAMLRNKSDIWSLSHSRNLLSIKRIAKTDTDMYIFKVDECLVRSIWNNLRFELLFAANDNDERYSIQTHANLLRNLWVQACEQPFGYPSYHSEIVLNK